MVRLVSDWLKGAILEIQDYLRLVGRVGSSLVTKPIYGRDIIEQLDAIGIGSLTVVFLTGAFTGMGLALLSGMTLATLGGLRAAADPVHAAVVGEPTALDFAVAQRGLLLVDLVAIGDQRHAANSETSEGHRNAIGALASDLVRLEGLFVGTRSIHVVPSHSHVSSKLRSQFVPPNSTTRPRALSYAIAWSCLAGGLVGGVRSTQVLPSHSHVSASWPLGPPRPPKSTTRPRALSYAIA